MKDQRTSGDERLLSLTSDHWVHRAASTTPPAGRPVQDASPGLMRLGRLVCALMVATVTGTAMAATPPSPQPMTLAQVTDAGAAGTGCSWSLSADRRAVQRTMRFAAAGERAVVRLRGETILLSPTPHARDLFPFTYADWRAGVVSVGIRQAGPSRRLGTEAFTSRATLRLVVRGSSTLLDGVMSCGS
jgi:hypothetical protein